MGKNSSHLSDVELGVKLGEQLVGKTMRIYWHMLRSMQPTTVRGIQRTLNLSSPSVALHHLEKLQKLDLVEQNEEGQYQLKKQVRVGLLWFFAGSGVFMVPRQLFYVCFYTVMLVATIIVFSSYFNPFSILLIIVLCFESITSWYEVFMLWRLAVFQS